MSSRKTKSYPTLDCRESWGVLFIKVSIIML